MTTMEAVKLAARELEKQTGDEGTNDGEHEAALRLLGALQTLFAEMSPARPRYFIEYRRPGHNWRRDDDLELFTDLNEMARRRASGDYKGVETRVREMLGNGEVL